jgi:hypothetical protein
MVLILRPADNKVLSISRKKVYCHELMYAKFDPNVQQRPQIDFRDFTLNETEIDQAIQSAIALDDEKKLPKDEFKVPEHVLSVKMLSDSKRNQGLLSPQQQPIPEEMRVQYHEANDSGECKTFQLPDVLKIQGGDRLLDEKIPITDSILNEIRSVDRKTDESVLTRGSLKRVGKSKSKLIDSDNIVSSKRKRKSNEKKVTVEKLISKQSKKIEIKARVTVPALKADDRVKIRTECFGKEYAVGRAKFTYGRVVKVNEKIVDVQWDNARGGGGVRMDARLSQLKRVNPIMALLKRMTTKREVQGWPFKTVETVLPVLELGSVLTESDPNASGNWPKDFVEALIRPD